MKFESVRGLLGATAAAGQPLWRVVLQTDAQETGITEQQSYEKMGQMLQAMREAVANYDPSDRSASGLSGGQGGLMAEAAAQGGHICGGFMAGAIALALQMAEANACMKRIVAAPTAGACGVLPAALLSYAEQFGSTEEELIAALYVAAGFGQVIASRASISGAEGGCQAEIGSASAMAAAALVAMQGGSPEMMAEAFTMALKNLLGLVCDPVAGLVEVPCVKRNVIGTMNAFAAAEMALAGITSRLPADEVLDAVRQVGSSLPEALRETGEGGLAASPTGQRIAKQVGALE